MKIYAANNKLNPIFNKILGKDLWVKVEIPMTGNWWKTLYIRLVDKVQPSPNLFAVNVLPTPEEYAGANLSRELLAQEMNTTELFYLDRVRLSEPVDLYTTEEFWEAWETSANMLEE